MTATASPCTNGKPQRKQLGDQLDRLDSIIDCLADALPAAVADACKEGARQAVKDAILEILTNPELRTLVAGVAPTPVAPTTAAPSPASAASGPAKPGPWTRFKATCRAVRDAVVGRCRAATAAATGAVLTLSAVMPVKKFLLVGAGVGAAVGVASYLCPHGVSAVVGGVCGAATAVGVQVGNWFRRSARSLGFGSTH